MGTAYRNKKMSLITSCPSCNTQFVVTDQQLSAYAGKVRCGNCHHVFNGKEYLIEQKQSIEPIPPAKVISVRIVKDKEADTAPPSTAPTAKILTVNTENPVTEGVTPASNDEQNKAPNITSEAPVPTPEEMIATVDGDNEIVEEIEITSQDKDFEAKPSKAEHSNNPPDDSLNATYNAEPDDSEFTFNPYNNDLPTKKPKKWLLFLLCALLIVLLLSQLVYFLRPMISAYYPQATPWLKSACDKIGCQVELPKNLDLLTIDDSDMQEHTDYQDVLQFSSTLVNHANHPQAFPLIELTLTNNDDTPIIRHTFSAQEYRPKDAALANGIGANEEVRIKLNLKNADPQVTGYRIALKY
jgi:predicted Zn finger-like uncharacterized protein